MKRSQIGLDSEEKKVVRLRFDAGFFFERAVRSLNRHQYEKALKYFRLAVEKEPDNPVNHCNLAGILSELGRYEESNKVLETVLNEVDPNLHECLFYMANNAGNMDNLELAESYLLEYLSRDPYGEYAEEAEDMLYMLSLELGRPPKEPIPVELPLHIQKHEEAYRYLETGNFLPAIDLLKEIIEMQPDYLPAYNNLAQAYYYMGKIEESLELIDQVLKKDPTNLHALCNFAVISDAMGKVSLSQRIIQTLKNLVPMHKEHAYKLALTMGTLGEHEVAYKLFSLLAKVEILPEPDLYHYAAVSAWNTGRLIQARRYWKKALALDQQSGVPLFYLKQVEKHLNHPDHTRPVVSYDYRIPEEKKDIPPSEQLEELYSDPSFTQFLYNLLDEGHDHDKFGAIQTLALLSPEDLEEKLREILLRPGENMQLKKMALFTLQDMNAEPPFMMNYEGYKLQIERVYLQTDFSLWKKKWDQVWDCCLKHMQDASSKEKQKAKALWKKQMENGIPTVHKVEGWAAAIEYLAIKQDQQAVTKTSLAQKYNISVSTVTRYIKQLSSLADEIFDKK
ncbi:tetratricopeptide repeat protein [Thermoflavimicrobium dichotomicum]|uniref:HTH domain-containing protein n=1 Tax=Thermoflavimicrobium dichotomicum TaxID=46223 RepID=A0A1I3JSB6_9BACL|nr:tetratricopeptide repeat protein [Thermoflavimicrobium dichotomicum]SFI63093.1 HTH domain-containing protein [Thermoflavimicrobium dichotomicum]